MTPQQISQFLDAIITEHAPNRQCIANVIPHDSPISRCFSQTLLENKFIVLVARPQDIPTIPGLGDLIPLGATYKDTIFLTQPINYSILFHELIHLVQWQSLGDIGFITLYMREIMNGRTLRNNCLEAPAYEFQQQFDAGIIQNFEDATCQRL